jgi:hypothetical protein
VSQSRSLAVIGLIILAICGAVWVTRPDREMSGVWLLQFEGSNFFEDATLATVRNFDRDDAGWLDEGDAIDIEKVLPDYDEDAGCWKVRAFSLRFNGKRHYGMSGHLGLWNSSYEVEEVIEMKPLPWPNCESPFDWDGEG